MTFASERIVHLTTVHPRFDTRIFIKMCSSLARAGYDVSLIVADGNGDEIIKRVSIFDVGKTEGGRLSRMTKTTSQVFNKAKELDASIYHLHDPELIYAGLKLKKLGKKVIFDAHEDLPKQILGKPYLNKITQTILSEVFRLYECWACPKFDAIIAATPFIRDKFLKINPNSIDINNFPLMDELANNLDWRKKESVVSFVGEITKIRGIEKLIDAMEYTENVRLNLVGKFSEKAVKERVKNYYGWTKVNEIGFLNRQQLNEVLAKSMAGIVTFLPAPNHIDAQPNKMFEYMSAGLPIITSNFPLWHEIVEINQCGICVDPLDSKAIGEAIQYLTTHSDEAKKMGANGRQAVEKKYNWSIEEQKLFNLYIELLN